MQKHPANKSELGFTLIELLIVIAISSSMRVKPDVLLCVGCFCMVTQRVTRF